MGVKAGQPACAARESGAGPDGAAEGAEGAAGDDGGDDEYVPERLCSPAGVSATAEKVVDAGRSPPVEKAVRSGPTLCGGQLHFEQSHGEAS